MNRLFQRVLNKVMHAFAGSGISVDEQGQMCLPDGLCPDRVHRFIELVMGEAFASPREAMHALFLRLGLDRRAVGLLDQILDANGGVELGAATLHGPALLAALPDFKQIPWRFRDFLIVDLGLACARSQNLEQAVVSAREQAAARLGCAAVWDEILARGEDVSELARPWRDARAA